MQLLKSRLGDLQLPAPTYTGASGLLHPVTCILLLTLDALEGHVWVDSKSVHPTQCAIARRSRDKHGTMSASGTMDSMEFLHKCQTCACLDIFEDLHLVLAPQKQSH